MIKLSRLADYAVVILAVMPMACDDQLMSAHCVSEASNLPDPTVAKVMKLLSKGGIISSTRGACGGYKLARPRTEITIEDVVVAVDGPICLTSCVVVSNDECDHACVCPVKGRWDVVNDKVIAALRSVTLDKMIAPAQQKPSTKESA